MDLRSTPWQWMLSPYAAVLAALMIAATPAVAHDDDNGKRCTTTKPPPSDEPAAATVDNPCNGDVVEVTGNNRHEERHTTCTDGSSEDRIRDFFQGRGQGAGNPVPPGIHEYKFSEDHTLVMRFKDGKRPRSSTINRLTQRLIALTPGVPSFFMTEKQEIRSDGGANRPSQPRSKCKPEDPDRDD
jgi:hypothetical protein